MLIRLNKLAFFLSIICLFLAIFNMSIKIYETNNIWFHPYFIILILSLILLGLNLVGFGGVRNKGDFIRSVVAFIILSILIVFVSYVLFIGGLFS